MTASTALTVAQQDTQCLNAPCKYELPAKLDVGTVADMLCRLDVIILKEIFNLSAKSVLYELVLSFVDKYADEAKVEVVRSCQVAKCFEFFSMKLQVLELEVLMTECKKMLLCNIEAKSSTMRFEMSLRSMFGLACNRFSLVGEGDPVHGETMRCEGGECGYFA